VCGKFCQCNLDSPLKYDRRVIGLKRKRYDLFCVRLSRVIELLIRRSVIPFLLFTRSPGKRNRTTLMSRNSCEYSKPFLRHVSICEQKKSLLYAELHFAIRESLRLMTLTEVQYLLAIYGRPWTVINQGVIGGEMGISKSCSVVISILLFCGVVATVTISGQSDLRSARRSILRSGERDGMLAICHATGSKENPYETLLVRDNGVAHQNHAGDIIPAPAEGCPSAGPHVPGEPVPEPITMLIFGAGVAAVGYAARRSKPKN
jgi:hypothetical protein